MFVANLQFTCCAVENISQCGLRLHTSLLESLKSNYFVKSDILETQVVHDDTRTEVHLSTWLSCSLQTALSQPTVLLAN